MNWFSSTINFCLLVVCIAVYSCNTNKQENTTTPTTTEPKTTSVDSLIHLYIDENIDRFTSEEYPRIAVLKDTTTFEGRNYVRAQLGNNMEDHFATIQWLYVDSLNNQVYEYDLANDELKPWFHFAEFNSPNNEIPPTGTYLMDAAFAEWRGESMGVKFVVTIKGDEVKVTYQGHGDLNANIGQVMAEGKLMKHKTGRWIITYNPSDKELNEVCGCTDGPATINFKTKQFWMC